VPALALQHSVLHSHLARLLGLPLAQGLSLLPAACLQLREEGSHELRAQGAGSG